MPTPEELKAEVLAKYPQFAYLLAVPELASLLLDAVNPDKGFSAQEFQARLINTQWWKGHGDAVRTWDALLATDPASAETRIRIRAAEVRDILSQFGVPNITDRQVRMLAEHSERYGLDLQGAEMRNVFAELIPKAPGQFGPGSFTQTLSAVKRLANQDYLVGISEQDAWNFARQVFDGTMTLEGIAESLKLTAKGQYGHLAAQIDQGIAPGVFFAPYRQMIAEELELGSAEAVNLLDPKWRSILSTSAGKEIRAMTLSEAQRHIRTQPEWQKTARAKSISASVGNELLRTFGAIA